MSTVIMLIQSDLQTGIKSPYEAKDDIKTCSHTRRWNPEYKLWVIRTWELNDVARCLINRGWLIDVYDGRTQRRVLNYVPPPLWWERPPKLVPVRSTEHDWVNERFAAAPADQRKSLYRQLMMEHHPDRGGSKETTQAINAAYERWNA